MGKKLPPRPFPTDGMTKDEIRARALKKQPNTESEED